MSSVSDYTAYMDSRRRMQDSFEAERTQSQSNHEKVISELKEDYNDDAKRVKDEYAARLESEKESAREEIRKLRDDLYDAQGKRVTKESEERNREKQEFVHYKEQVEKEANRRVQKATDYSNSRAIEVAQQQDERIAQAIEQDRKSHIEETKAMREELEVHRNLDRDVSKERANAKVEVIEEYEGEHLKERDRLADAFGKQINKLQRDKAEMKDYHDRAMTATEFEANAKAQKLLRTQKDDFGRIQRDSKAQSRQNEEMLMSELRRERDRNNKVMNNVIEIEGERTNRALEQKDRTYQEYLARHDQEVRSELDQKNARIAMLETTDDPQKVSPAVVEKIHNTERELVHKEFQAYKNVQEQNINAMRKRDVEDRTEMKKNFDETTSAIARRAQMDNDRTIRDLNTAFTDLKDKQETDMRETRDKSQSALEHMKVQSAQEMSNLQKRDMEALQDQRMNLNQQMDIVRDEQDFLRKAQDREWHMKFQTARRDYERKITDMQDQHSAQVNEIRMEYDKKLRDQDRHHKADIEGRVRQYEHIIKQQELSFKEKERFLREQSDEEIDKMRRANAHLLQKKS